MESENNKNNKNELVGEFITSVLDIAFTDMTHGRSIRDQSLLITRKLKKDSNNNDNDIDLFILKDMILSLDKMIETYQSTRDKLNKIALQLEVNRAKN